MDLKLKDEVTKLLISSPGLSIGKIAKKTGNYYSYTHKVISEMEKEGLVKIEKDDDGKTNCRLTESYKKKWVGDLKRMVFSLSEDAEIKAAFLLMYLFIAFTALRLTPGPQEEPAMFRAEIESLPPVKEEPQALPAPERPADLELYVFLAVSALSAVWLFKRLK